MSVAGGVPLQDANSADHVGQQQRTSEWVYVTINQACVSSAHGEGEYISNQKAVPTFEPGRRQLAESRGEAIKGRGHQPGKDGGGNPQYFPVKPRNDATPVQGTRRERLYRVGVLFSLFCQHCLSRPSHNIALLGRPVLKISYFFGRFLIPTHWMEADCIRVATPLHTAWTARDAGLQRAYT